MTSSSFRQALGATGYLTAGGRPAPGLTQAGDAEGAALRALFADDRVGLKADALFKAQRTPMAIFKDAGSEPPTDDQLRRWHEAAWNIGVAPLLWVVTPTEVRLYDCYASPHPTGGDAAGVAPIGRFVLGSEDRMRALDAACGRLATETGAFWRSELGARIDRRHRVDRELLSEIKALEEELVAASTATSTGSPWPQGLRSGRDFAQRLVGRCIFTWYLLDRGIAQRFLPPELPPNLGEMFATPDRAFALFDWLRATFNGDLFPMDDPGAERQQLGPAHLALMREFVAGRSLVPERRGQGRLFQFRFDAIPVDLISSIYQQFARSSAAEEAASQGLHYTPVELVHLTLDPVFEGLPSTARVIDPTCGSGAFLVEAFRRLVWRATGGAKATRQLVRRVLYTQLFGIDINRSALGIAAFSLYLAALELDDEPVADATDLKFHRLIDTTLFEADAIADELPAALVAEPFDAIVGNPPWTFISRADGAPKREARQRGDVRPRRSPDWAFLAVASRLAGDAGRIGMVMKATPFFSKDVHAVEARSALLSRLAPSALINLSLLRKEDLFPDATGPALIFFARCTLTPAGDRLLVGSIPWTPDFRRTGVFHLGPGEISAVPLKRVLRTPAILKAATFGTVRDGWLIERLEREFPTLDGLLLDLGIRPRMHRGQGFKVRGAGQTKTPDSYFELPVVTPDAFTPFRIEASALGRLTHETLHRVRRASIFHGPLLICSKVGSDAGAEQGRYSAALSLHDALYTESFFGISFAEAERRNAKVLSGILNASLTAFQLAFGGPTWGLERPTVLPHDLLSLRVPPLLECDDELLDAVVRAEADASSDPQDGTLLVALDDAVLDLYGLEPDERVLAGEAVSRAHPLVFESRAVRSALAAAPAAGEVRAYAGQVARTVDAHLRARGQRHLEAITYSRASGGGGAGLGVPGVTAVRFVMAAGAPGDAPVVREGDPADLEALAGLLRGRLEADIPPYLNERRQLRLYGADDLFVLKPTEARYWTRTAGLNDADVILADHWLRRRDAALA
jgi:hypothetical protein